MNLILILIFFAGEWNLQISSELIIAYHTAFLPTTAVPAATQPANWSLIRLHARTEEHFKTSNPLETPRKVQKILQQLPNYMFVSGTCTPRFVCTPCSSKIGIGTKIIRKRARKSGRVYDFISVGSFDIPRKVQSLRVHNPRQKIKQQKKVNFILRQLIPSAVSVFKEFQIYSTILRVRDVSVASFVWLDHNVQPQGCFWRRGIFHLIGLCR